MAAVPRVRLASAAVVVWSALSCALALSPAGFGGVPRAVNSIAFLLLGPGVALATFLRRRYTVGSRAMLAPGVVAVVSETFSLTLLVLIAMVLLLVGAWSVGAVVVAVTVVAVGVAVCPAGTVAEEVADQAPELAASPAVPALPAARPAPTRPAAARPAAARPAARSAATRVPAARTPPSDDIVMWS